MLHERPYRCRSGRTRYCERIERHPEQTKQHVKRFDFVVFIALTHLRRSVISACKGKEEFQWERSANPSPLQ